VGEAIPEPFFQGLQELIPFPFLFSSGSAFPEAADGEGRSYNERHLG